MNSEPSDSSLGFDSKDPSAAEKLLPLVYRELRELAAAKLLRENPGQTLNATALVHEAYLKLAGGPSAHTFANRRHFFSAAAQAMNQILVDNARRKKTERHGGQWNRVAPPLDLQGAFEDPGQLIAIHELLELLAPKNPRAAEVAKMRLFLQMSFGEIAEVLELSGDTAEADWAYARAWMQREWRKGDKS